MYDELEFADEYCGFEQSDRDAWEDQQVFLDREFENERDEFIPSLGEDPYDDPRDEDWAMDMEDEADDSDWPQAEADGFFAEHGFHDFE